MGNTSQIKNFETGTKLFELVEEFLVGRNHSPLKESLIPRASIHAFEASLRMVRFILVEGNEFSMWSGLRELSH